MEQWRPIPGYEGAYEVSDFGRVRSLSRRDSRGRARVRRLRSPAQQQSGWNDDPSDNRLANLRWDTRAANVRDSVRNRTHHMARRTHCPQGHAYAPDNTYHYPGGSRACNECRRQYREEHKEERRAKGREYMRRRRSQVATAANTGKAA